LPTRTILFPHESFELTIVIDEIGRGREAPQGFALRSFVKRPINLSPLQYSVPFEHVFLLLGIPPGSVDAVGLMNKRDHYRPHDLARVLSVRKVLNLLDIYH
jgi:hypothetical protein